MFCAGVIHDNEHMALNDMNTLKARVVDRIYAVSEENTSSNCEIFLYCTFLPWSINPMQNQVLISRAALSIFEKSGEVTSSIFERRFKGLFGVTTNVAGIVWTRRVTDIPKRIKPFHLLWSLLFLKIMERSM